MEAAGPRVFRGPSSFERLDDVEEGDVFVDAPQDAAPPQQLPDVQDVSSCSVSFDTVLEEEAASLSQHWERGDHGGSIAVCLSAGGIRSAACSLGVLWKLAEVGLLRSVDYLSTVSGGGFTGTAYCTHLLDEKAPPPRDPAACDAWHRGVVAKLTDRMQRNCGYFVSFHGSAWAAPADGSSCMPRGVFDVVLLGAVVMVVIAFPLFEIARVAVPTAIYIELLYGRQLRQVFCVQALCSEYVYSSVMHMLQPQVDGDGRREDPYRDHREHFSTMCQPFQDTVDLQDLPEVFLRPWLWFTLPLGIAYLLMQQSGRMCFPRARRLSTDGSLGSSGSSDNMRGQVPGGPEAPGATATLVHHSITKLIRAFFVISIVLNVIVCAIFVMQQVDWRLWMWTDNLPDGRSFRGSWRPSFCACLLNVPSTRAVCSSSTFANPEQTWMPLSDLAIRAMQDMYGRNVTEDCLTAGTEEIQRLGRDSRSTRYLLIWILGILLAAFMFGAVSQGTRPASAILTAMLPAALLWVAASICQWKVYGPLTGEDVTLVPANMGRFSVEVWQWTVLGLVVLHSVFVLFYKRLASVSSTYYRICLTRAFYARGRDVPLSALEKRGASIPVLIGGCTLNEFCRPVDPDRHSAFAITPLRMGCARTKYVRTPGSWTLGRAMGISGAALDGAVLTSNNSFLNRLYLRITSAYLGGWVPFDDHGSTWSAAKRSLRTWGPSNRDSWPGMVGLLLWLASFVVATLFDPIEVPEAQMPSGVLSSLGLAHTCAVHRYSLALGFGVIALLFSVCFFGFTGPARVLLCMPLLRSMTSVFKPHYDWRPPPYLRLTDGGLTDKLGLVECLRRRVRWIIVSDSCTDLPTPTLRDLRLALDKARREIGCSFSVGRSATVDVEEEMENYRRREVPFIHLVAIFPPAPPGRSPAHSGTISDIFHIR